MRLTLLLLCVATLSACIHVESTKEAALKASAGVGEAVGKTSSEFVKGVKDGIDQTFNCHLVLAENLQKAQITTGKYFITSDSGSTTRNKVSAYLIFNKNYTGTITARITDPAEREYGRKAVQVKAIQGQAIFIDFVFDKRTDIESRSTIALQ